MPMLQFATSSAPQPFQRRSPNFDRPPHAHEAADPSPAPVHLHDRRRSLGGVAGGYATGPGSQSPALSALASLAASAPAAATNTSNRTDGESTRSSTPNNMNHPQYSPGATAGGAQNGNVGQPVCHNCGTATTPLWRRDESGAVLCNACGLFVKLHGRPRPISLKTDVIKSRNRTKTTQPKKRDSQPGSAFTQSLPYPTPHSDAALQQTHNGHVYEQPRHEPSPGSMSRGNTPALATHNPNIAPQHIFDTVSLPSDSFASPSLPSFSLRQPSLSNGELMNPGTDAPQDPSQSHEAVLAHNNQLRTRVNELEVINDLFRGRVDELEAREREARCSETAKADELKRLCAQLDAAHANAAELQKRVVELEEAGGEGEPARKRSRLEDADDADAGGGGDNAA